MKPLLIIVTTVLLGLSLVRPPYVREQTLQHTPTVLALILLTLDCRRNILSVRSFVCISLFLWLHILGARYIYSFVPYDRWMLQLTGASVSGWFGWHRNHYDRLVHFLSGVLFVFPAFQLAVDFGRMSRPWAMLFSVLVVLAVGSLYEVFEWLLTRVAASEAAEAYNGQQGDIWDAQKDMALAFVGSLCSVLILVGPRTMGRIADQQAKPERASPDSSG